MMEALRPSIEEAQPINSQLLALDYIGKRATQVCVWGGGGWVWVWVWVWGWVCGGEIDLWIRVSSGWGGGAATSFASCCGFRTLCMSVMPWPG
jgi:hypothetical protein